MTFTTALLNVQAHNFGIAQTARSVPPRNAKVALVGATSALEINTAESVTAVFEGVRYSYLRIACSATWRAEGTGDNPLLPEHFEGGVYPSGPLAWAVGQINVGAAFTLAASNPPIVPLTGRIVLEDLVDCETSGELVITVASVEIGVGDAVVSLNVPFVEIDFGLGSDFLPGVNLAGAEFAHDDEAKVPGVRDTDYTWPTTAELDYYAGKGLKLFRIPFIFRRLFRVPALVPSDLSKLLALVDYADTLGCTVLLDPHEYAEIADVGFTTPSIAAQFVSWWAQLITALDGRENVIAGLMNEPRPVGETAGISPADWIRLGVNPLIASIRGAGFTGRIAVPGTSWTGAHSWISSGNAAAFSAPPALQRMVYYAGWTKTRLPPSELPLNASVTHYMHFSVLPTAVGGLDFVTNELTAGHRTATVAHAHSGGKLVLLSVGGAGSITNMRLACNGTNRATFVANLAAAVAADDYDGLDFDYEPLPSSDQTDYRATIIALRAAMPSAILTTAVPATAEAAAVVAGVASSLDHINIMTYDLAGNFPGWETWHNSPLFNGGHTFHSTGEPLPCAELSVTEFVAAGISRAKLGIGIAFYGRRWSGGGGTDTGGVSKPRQTWTTTPGYDDVNVVPYHEIVTLRATMTDLYDAEAEGAYLSTNLSGSANDRFIPYENTSTVQAKMEWAAAEGLASVIAWDIDSQYIPTATGTARHPLMQAIAASAGTGGVVDPLHNYVIEAHQYLDTDSSGTTDTITLGAGSSRLVAFTAWARAQGLRAILGEVGWPDPEGNVEGAAILDYMAANRDVWLGWCIWAGGPWWGSYSYSIEPTAGPVDAGQMAVIAPRASAGGGVVHSFFIERNGNLSSTCQVEAKVEGTGANPITGSMFVGNVLPTINAVYSSGQTRYLGALEFDAGSVRPATRLTGRIVLRAPVSCRVDPAAAERAFAIKPTDAPVISPYDLVEENWVVHAPVGQSSRITWLPGGGFEIAGAANADGFSIALWCKEPLPTNYELNLEYEKNEDLAAADGGGRFLNVWHGYVGSTGGRPVDVTAWTSSHYRPGGSYTDVSDSVYGDFGQGYRNSLDTETNQPENRNEVRLVWWDEGTTDRPAPTPEPPAFPMAGTGSVYQLIFRRQGETLTAAKEPSGELVKWEGPFIANLGQPGGRLGIKGARGRGGIFRPRTGLPVVRDLGDDPDEPPPPPPPPTGGDSPYGPWRVFNRTAATGRRVPVSTPAALQTAIANALSGDRILLPPGSTFNMASNWTINRGVSGEDAYYIGTDTDSEDPSSWARITGGDINFGANARRCVFGGLQLNGQHITSDGATLCQIERLQVTGVINNVDDAYGAPGFFRTQQQLNNCLIGFIRYLGCSASFYDTGDHGSIGCLFTHIHQDARKSPGKFFQPGRNSTDSLFDTRNIVQYCLDSGTLSSRFDQCEWKTNGWEWRYNTAEVFDSADMQFKIRHGRLGELGDGGTGPKRGMFVHDNLWIQMGSHGPWLSHRGAYHTFINNWCVKSGAIGLDSPLGNGRITAFEGPSDGRRHPPTTTPPGTGKTCTNYMSGYALRAGGNRGFTVGTVNSACDAVTPRYKPADAIITSTGRGRNTRVDAAGWVNPDFSTQLPGADYDKVPLRQTAADVGPRAWRRAFANVYVP